MARRAILKTHLLQCQRHGSSLRPCYGLASPRSRRVRDRDGVVLQKRELLRRARLCSCRLSHPSACPVRLEVNLFSTVQNGHRWRNRQPCDGPWRWMAFLSGGRPCRFACSSRSHPCPTTPPASPAPRSPAATLTFSCVTASAPCSTTPALLISIPGAVSPGTRPGGWRLSRSCSFARA